VLAIVAPGQGAQTPGMLAPWMEDPCAAAILIEAGTATGIDLIGLSAADDPALLRPTEVAQPFVVAASLAGAAAVVGSARLAVDCDVVTGHSVGEWAAAVVGGYLPVAIALALVAARGRAMASAAAAAAPSGMSAILGGDEAGVLAALAGYGLTPANMNGAGQIVAAGSLAALAALAANPPAGARVRRLEVAAAFHTETMTPAVPLLASACGTTTAVPGHAVLVGNATGRPVAADALIPSLITQVSQPVRFDLCLREFVRLGVTAVLELPPAGVLTALVKRQLPGVATFVLRGPGDVPAARDFIVSYASGSAVVPGSVSV